MTDQKIFPDILAGSIDELNDKVQQTQDFSSVVHVDIIDGVYADNITVGSGQLQKLDWGDLALDVHLLVVDPEEYLGDIHLAGASRALGQVERMHDIGSYIERCGEYGLGVGLGLDLYTPVSAIADYIDRVSVVLLMSVKAGFSGQAYRDVTDKILDVRDLGYMGDIVIDGGVTEEVIPECIEAGANQYAVNSRLWESDDVEGTYIDLTSILDTIDE